MFAYRPLAPADAVGHAVVTDRFVCLLGDESDAGIAVELYRLLDAPGTTIHDVLDVFAAHGEAHRFAIVEVLDAAQRILHVAVRGDVAVDMSDVGSTRLSGPSGSTWFNGELHGVQSLRLSLDQPSAATAEPSATDPLPIRRGVVTTRDISFDPAAGAPTALRPADESVLSTRAIELPKVTDAPPKPRTLMPRSPIAPVLAGKGDARTARVDLASVMDPPTWTLSLPDGSEFEITGPAVLGRRPWRTSPDETTTFYVVAPSPKREISGVHLEVSIVGDELQARDLDSTNGTLVLTASRSPRLLHGGRSTTLRTGDILDLGESFRISVGTRPAR